MGIIHQIYKALFVNDPIDPQSIEPKGQIIKRAEAKAIYAKRLKSLRWGWGTKQHVHEVKMFASECTDFAHDLDVEAERYEVEVMDRKSDVDWAREELGDCDRREDPEYYAELKAALESEQAKHRKAQHMHKYLKSKDMRYLLAAHLDKHFVTKKEPDADAVLQKMLVAATISASRQ